MSVLYSKSSPVGIDVPIQKLQNWFNTKLPTIWGVSASTYASYGRAYTNIKGENRQPEVYIGNLDFFEVFPDDNYKASSFFYVNSDVPFDGRMFTADVKVVFFIDLSQVKGAITHRADEEVRNDILALLLKEPYGFKLTGFTTGIQNVYADFDFEDSKKVDMQPYHVVKFDLELIYNNYTPYGC